MLNYFTSRIIQVLGQPPQNLIRPPQPPPLSHKSVDGKITATVDAVKHKAKLTIKCTYSHCRFTRPQNIITIFPASLDPLLPESIPKTKAPSVDSVSYLSRSIRFSMPSVFGHKIDAVAAMKTSPGFKAAALSTSSFISFASVALPLCSVTSTVSGIYAQAKLLEPGHKISSDVKKLTESTKVANSLQYQAHFAQHVYDIAASRIRVAKIRRKKTALVRIISSSTTPEQSGMLPSKSSKPQTLSETW